MSKLRIVMAQLDLLVGDIEGNRDCIIDAAIQARDEMAADAIVFPELSLTGYPPEDLLLRPGLQQRVLQALEQIKRDVQGIAVVLGFPRPATGGLYNAAAVIQDGQIIGHYHKQHLPNYSVFDEKRYFSPGSEACVVLIKGIPVGLTICEDIWQVEPVAAAVEKGARLILNLNASPFHINKRKEREEVVAERVSEVGVPIVYVNLVGGQDELVFDGGSFVMDVSGNTNLRAPAFVEGLYPVDFEVPEVVTEQVTPIAGPSALLLEEEAGIYQALVLGTRDYIEKNGFAGVVLGLSGGIDSALTLAIAVDAIGAARVEVVMLPSRYTADMSNEDAEAEAEALGVEHRVISIEPMFKAFLDGLAEEFAGTEPDVTEENMQARCRGVILMAISNKKRKILLTTGNKSEMAVGYATLYGDMAGGFAVLKDVSKTLVYRLSKYRNSISPVIPQRVIDRPPSAELAPDQRDTDSLPDYPELDAILERYVEQDQCREDIVAAGYDEATVSKVIRMVDRNEYKRRQAAPGVRITRRAFGRDRRYPITSGFGQLVD
ncbi:MAG: NAD+ synthase [Gammaproteobacteria bacterium]|nr:NAD+ synthase [Gammaproteobacteria bacterium]